MVANLLVNFDKCMQYVFGNKMCLKFRAEDIICNIMCFDVKISKIRHILPEYSTVLSKVSIVVPNRFKITFCIIHSQSHYIQTWKYFLTIVDGDKNQKLVPWWGTDGRLPLSGDFRSLNSLTFRRASLTNFAYVSILSGIKLNLYRTHFVPSSKSRDTKN